MRFTWLRSGALVAVAVALAVPAASCSSADPTASSPTTGTAPVVASTGCEQVPIAPGDTTRKMVADGVERTYELIVPEGYDGRTPMPVVLGLHALSVTYSSVPGMTGFADMAPRHRFIGVAPSGRVDGATPYWLAAPSADQYDVDFISQLLDQLESELCVDTSRIFTTGMSNGAQMSSLLACRLPERIAAAAPVAGVEFADECAGRPVPGDRLSRHGGPDRDLRRRRTERAPHRRPPVLARPGSAGRPGAPRRRPGHAEVGGAQRM